MTATTLDLARHAYGKHQIRLIALPAPGTPGTPGTVEPVDPVELTAEVMLIGGFEASYLHGDNRRVVTTDALVNLVVLTVERLLPAPVETVAEAIACELHDRYRFVPGASVELAARTWCPAGAGQPTSAGHRGRECRAFRTFTRDGGTEQRARALLHDGGVHLLSGIGGLHLVVTTGSSFEGFLVDDLTTSQPLADRPLYGIVDVEWTATPAATPDATTWEAQRAGVHAAILAAVEDTSSRSVQHLVATMCGTVLAEVPAVDEVTVVYESIPLARAGSGSHGVSAAGSGSRGTGGDRSSTGRMVAHAVTGHPRGVTEATMRRSGGAPSRQAAPAPAPRHTAGTTEGSSV